MNNYGRRSRRSKKKKLKIQGISLGLFAIAFGIYLAADTVVPGKQDEPVILDGLTEVNVTGDGSVLNIAAPVMVDDISLAGLSKEEAREKILNTYKWELKLRYQDEIKPVKNLLPEVVDVLLDEIYSNRNHSGTGQYRLSEALIEAGLKIQAAEVAADLDQEPSSGQLTGRDHENSRWIYSDGKAGIRINQEKIVRDLMAMVSNRNFSGIVNVEADELQAGASAAEVREQYQVIGSFSTMAAKNKNRDNNITLAMNALDGLVLLPGEEFSFNLTTGNRTLERGYKPAGAYRNGEFVEEPGGGVCQVSSTLYNAMIFAGVTVLERNPHSFEPSYVTPGEDAMVSYDGYSGPDLRFINNQKTSLAIRAVFADNKLTISIIGIPILDERVEVFMKSEQTKANEPAEPEYVEDSTLQPGQEVVVTKGTGSTTWKTYLVTRKNGEVIKEEYFHTTTYRGKKGLTKRNSAKAVPEETVVSDGVSIPETAEVPDGSEAITETSPQTEGAVKVPEGPDESVQESMPAVEPNPTGSDAGTGTEIGPGIGW